MKSEENDKLFGSVTKTDIEKLLLENNIKIDTNLSIDTKLLSLEEIDHKYISFIYSKIKNLKFGKNCTVIEPSNIYGSKFGKNVFIGPFVEIQKNSYIGDNTRVQIIHLYARK